MSDMSNGINTAVECLNSESKTGFSQTLLSSVVTLDDGSNSVTPQHIKDWLMSSQQDFPVSHLVSRANKKRQQMIETCGPKQLRLFDSSDPLLSFSKTFPVCSLQDMPSPLPTTCNNLVIKYYHQQSSVLVTLALPTSGSGSGYVPTPRSRESGDYQYDQGNHDKPRSTLTGWVKMWPTPAAHDSVHRTEFNPVTTSNGTIRHKNKAGGQSRVSLSQIVNLWPTPTARDMRSRGSSEANRKSPALNHVATGGNGEQLNPAWVEWLMGWPIGWSSLEPLSTKWQLGWDEEPAIPRTATGIKDRVARLKAIGNGQVPAVVAAAWRLLTEVA